MRLLPEFYFVFFSILDQLLPVAQVVIVTKTTIAVKVVIVRLVN
jgi:hypothetical protein